MNILDIGLEVLLNLAIEKRKTYFLELVQKLQVYCYPEDSNEVTVTDLSEALHLKLVIMEHHTDITGLGANHQFSSVLLRERLDS